MSQCKFFANYGIARIFCQRDGEEPHTIHRFNFALSEVEVEKHDAEIATLRAERDAAIRNGRDFFKRLVTLWPCPWCGKHIDETGKPHETGGGPHADGCAFDKARAAFLAPSPGDATNPQPEKEEP